MKTVLSIPARMKSARLPGKVLAPIGDHPMLWYQVQRLRNSSAEVVIATTEESDDDPIAAFAHDLGIRCVRGSTNDLIARHAKVAKETECDVFVLSGADDPLLEPDLVDMVADKIGTFRYAESVGWPLGMNCWAWDRAGMFEAAALAEDPDEREHVVPWFVRRPERYPRASVTRSPSLYDTHRLTVDWSSDLDLIAKIIEALWPVKPDFDLRDIDLLLRTHPQWLEINRGAPQYFYDREPIDEGVKA